MIKHICDICKKDIKENPFKIVSCSQHIAHILYDNFDIHN